MATPDISLYELWEDMYDYEPREFNKILRDSWMLTEFPNAEEIDMLIELFQISKKDLLMNEQEKKLWEQLPKEVNLFRGLQTSKSKENGLSWTLDKEKAIWFANRWKENGKVLTVTIPKEKIFTVFLERGENEVVIDTRELKAVEVLNGS